VKYCASYIGVGSGAGAMADITEAR